MPEDSNVQKHDNKQNCNTNKPTQKKNPLQFHQTQPNFNQV